MVAALLAGCETPSDPKLSALAAAQNETDAKCATQTGRVIPVQYHGNLPTVPVEINGKPARFILDTGAAGTGVFKYAKERLQLPDDPGGRFHEMGGGGSPVRLRDAAVSSFTFGRFEANINSMIVMASSATSGYDGLLGMDFLGQFDLLLDLPHRRVVIFPPRSCATPPAGMTAVTLDRPPPGLRASRVQFLVNLDGQDLRAIVDTGAARTMVNRESIHKLDISRDTLAAEALPKDRVFVVGSLREAQSLHRFQRLTVGPVTVEQPELLVGDIGRSDRASFVAIEMLLGEDFLRLHQVWMSGEGRRVHIITNMPPLVVEPTP